MNYCFNKNFNFLIKKTIFIFFLSFRLFVNSQEELLFSSSDYFETMQNKLNLKFELDNDLETFEIDINNSKYSVKPNTGLRMSVAVNHKFLNLSLGFSPNFLKGDSNLKGNTKVFKINMDFFFLEKWTQTFEVSSIAGYYVEDVSDFNSFNVLSNTEYIILPHAKTRVYRGITSYNFNKNYSLKAVLNQNEIQRKSAGSFVPSYTYEYFKMTNKSFFQKVQSVNFILNAAYYYTFVINNKWYSNLSMSPGLGYGFNKITTEGVDNSEINWNGRFIYNINSLIGLGYNSNSFFGGITFSGIATSYDDIAIIKLKSVRSYIKVSIGYRFKAPKFVNQSFDWMEDLNPLN